MDYLKYTIHLTAGQDKDIVLAYLSQLDFEAFEEEGDWIHGYVSNEANTDAFQEALEVLKQEMYFDFEVTSVVDQNWNEIWESNFTPVKVENFCYIRAPFHNPDDEVALNIIINPKMAFGTGHHATTYMMVSYLQGMDLKGKKVFDFGCGTGILAVVAGKLGATEIDAIDIDDWAVENTEENAALNEVKGIRVSCRPLQELSANRYDLILANINRNVILESLNTLYHMMNTPAQLFISGILTSDRDMVIKAAEQGGFKLGHITERGEWIAARLMKV